MLKQFAIKLMKRIKGYRPDVVTLLLVGLIVFLWFRPPAKVSDLQIPLPAMSVSLASGKTMTLAELKGKVVLLNFWATWCPYCRHEFPAMQEFYDDYRSQGFEILALSIDDTPAQVAAFMHQRQYRFLAGVMGDNSPEELGSINKIPTSFVIDRCGVLRHKVAGQVHYARLKQLVVPLLATDCVASAP